MTRKQRYYLKQKVAGFGFIIGSILLMIFGKDFIGPEVGDFMIIIPAGLFMMFTKQRVWIDNYSLEMDRKEELQRR